MRIQGKAYMGDSLIYLSQSFDHRSYIVTGSYSARLIHFYSVWGAAKVLRHLAVEFDFQESWTHSAPFSPKNANFFLFLRLHRPQHLHNIELGGRGYQRINAS